MNNLKFYRNKAGLTACEAAVLCFNNEARQSNYSKYEKGIGNPRPATKVKIYNGFKSIMPTLKFKDLWGEEMNEAEKGRAAAATATLTEQKPLKHQSRQLTTSAASALSFIPAKNATLTMSTREIAALCGKQHQHVKRDFSNICEALGFGASKFGHSYLDVQNKTQTEYLLTKELSITLVSGYDVRMRHAIIKRWLELEAQQRPAPQPKPAALPTVKELAQMVIEAEEEKERLQLENKQKDSKISALEDYLKGGITPPKFAKTLPLVNSQQINAFLEAKGWLHKDGRGNYNVSSRARYIYLDEKQGYKVTARNGEEYIKPVFHLTKKGAKRIFDWFNKGELPTVKKELTSETQLATYDFLMELGA